ncbi:MAG: PBSX family phage terminase large subunit, partial [Oscillospiraceae bacterium]|nr:PBSX family phage terminase large subunit [Oscillospiraceae bacterium]
MTFTKLSPKQKKIFKWCYGDSIYNAIICDGAVRSGKTVCMITSFILWAMKYFDGAIFGICGKTVRSAERNIISPLMGITD